MVSLGKLSGGSGRGIAFDASLDGSVIVGEDGPEAFYWSSTLGMVNLKDVLIANGATGLDGWLLTEATGVSYDGQTVVGTGIHNGVTQAFVATVPEPSTVVLAIIAGVGSLGFSIRYRRRVLRATPY
jgi:hypothetical protein